MFRSAYEGKPPVQSYRFQAEIHIFSGQVFTGGRRIIGSGAVQGLHLHGIHIKQAALYSVSENQAALMMLVLRPQPVNGNGASPSGIDQNGGENVFAATLFRTVASKSHSPENLVVTREEMHTSKGTSGGRGIMVAADRATPEGVPELGRGT